MSWKVEKYESFGEGIHREISVDHPDYPSGGMWDATNIVYSLESNLPEKMRGYAQLGETITGTPTITGLFDFKEGTQLIATASDGKIYKRTTGNFSQVTGGTGYSTTASVRWSAAMFYGSSSTTDVLVMANGVNAPCKYDGTSVTALSDAPATGQFPVPWMSRIWMFSSDIAHYKIGRAHV